MEIYTFEVGKSFGLYADRYLPLKEANQLIMNEKGNLMLVITMIDMTPEEQEILWDRRVRVRLVEGPGNLMEQLFRFEGSDLIIETVFDPTLYSDDRINQFRNVKLITVVGVEGRNNIIKSLQVLNLPYELHKKLFTSWLFAQQDDDYSAKYNKWISLIQSKYSVKELWDLGNDYGYLE